MSWSNFWVLVTGGAVTLFFGQIARMIERGNHRGRLRQEIRQDLDLIERLDEWPVFRQRIVDNVHDSLAEYAPDPLRAGDLDDDFPTWRMLGWSLLAMTPIGVVIAAVSDLTWWQMVGVGGVLGILANIVPYVVLRRRRAEAVEHRDPGKDEQP